MTITPSKTFVNETDKQKQLYRSYVSGVIFFVTVNGQPQANRVKLRNHNLYILFRMEYLSF